MQDGIEHGLDHAAVSIEFWRSELEGFEAGAFPSRVLCQDGKASSMVMVEDVVNVSSIDSGFSMTTIIRLAWALVLSKHSSPDVVFGVSGPTRASAVPFRIAIDSSACVKEALQTVQAKGAAIALHEQLGFERIKNICPGSTVACQFQNLLPIQPKSDSESHKSRGATATPDDGYPLTVTCDIKEDKTMLYGRCDTRSIDPKRTQVLLQQLRHVIVEITTDIHQKLSDINMIDPDTLRQLQTWNSKAPEIVDIPVHEVVSKHFVNQPNAQAVSAWDGEWTYGELDLLSSKLADLLIFRGVCRGNFVPVFIDKSKWAPVAIMGVMRAGGAFVLMDASNPIQRLKGMCTQLNAQIILSSTLLQEKATELGPSVITLDNESETPNCNEHSWKSSVARASDPAFAVFTSGSTGVPKGVVIEHSAIATSLSAYCQRVGVTQSTRMLQFASYLFDVSVNDHLSALFAGGCICIPSESQRLNDLQTAINDLQATTMDMTPSMAQVLRPEQVPSVHTVILGGESVTAENLVAWGSLKLIEVYGPAECSVTCTIRSDLKPGDNPSNIGLASGGTCWIVDQDDHERLAPLYTIGELVVGGPIVARGYLNNDALTASSFITNPSWTQHFPSQAAFPRYYKTGDLARYLPDGSMQYVGRKDAQVKVRGQRIELGEIEYHLKQGLRYANQVVVDVIVTSDDSSRPVLTAFVESTNQADLQEPFHGKAVDINLGFTIPSDAFRQDVKFLQSQLRDRLPSSMIPSVFITMSKIPLSGSGKIDRKRLRTQAASLSKREVEFYMVAGEQKRAPVSDVEVLIQSLCAKVLNIAKDDIGMDDTFFQHGGDSIFAIRFVGAANEHGFKIQVADIFEDPRLSSVAQKVQAISGQDSSSSLLPFSLFQHEAEVTRLLSLSERQCGVNKHDVEDIYPATALQEGLLALSVKQKGTYITHVPLKLEDATDLERFQKAWEATVNANSILRTRLVQSEDGKLHQVVLRTGLDWQHATSLKAYLVEQAEVQFELGCPLARQAIVTDHERGCPIFVVTLHHSAYDGWSLPILIEDLLAAYYGQKLGHRDFSGFIGYLAKRDPAASQDFWRSKFEGLSCSHFPALPSDNHIPSATETMEHTVELAPPSFCSSSKFTTSTILRLAWASVLATYTDSDDVVFGAIVVGRSLPVAGIGEMTGPTIATVPLRVQLNPEQKTSAALDAIQTDSIQTIPFEQDGLPQIRKMGSEAALACEFRSLLVVQGQGQELPQSSLFTPDPEYEDSEWAESTYFINVVCETGPSSIRFKITFDPNVVDTPSMQMIMHQLAHVTNRLIQDQNVNGSLLIGHLKEISPEGMSKIRDWNQHVPEAVDCCAHDMILSHSQQTPDAIAICAWDGSVTYRELDALSLSLACHLHTKGVGVEVRVPILLEKSMWTPIAILGIIRAGGAFVLLDPSLPFARLEYLCGALGAPLAVTSSQHASLALSLLPQAVVLSQETVDSWEDQVVLPRSQPQQALYTIFTSGSTGLPKGVVIEHFSFCTSAKVFAEITRMDQSTRVFQFASYAFDVSVSDHLVPLIHGACLCIPSPSQVKDNLAGAIAEFRATWADLTPSVARILEPRDVSTLKTLNLGGEGMIKADVDQWHDKLHLVNVYGPAECSCTTVVRAPMQSDSYPQDIGYGTGGVCWVTDPGEHNRLLPVGAIGELLIEGPIVGRGYLNEPAKTEAAFLRHLPWLGSFRSIGSVHRVYATGDLVQYQSNGSLRYVGRKDMQVKLRGQRIELGEIEHHIQECFPDVQQYAVELVRLKDKASQPMLLAFLQFPCMVPRVSDGPLTRPSYSFQTQVQEALSNLQKAIPSYMIPTAFVAVTEIPLSPSAKVDRKQLRNLASSLSLHDLKPYMLSRSPRRTPTTQTETALCELFSTVLNKDLEDIGIDDSFFDLGGDSITAMQLTAQCRKRGISTSVQQIFLQRTISHIGKHAEVISNEKTNQLGSNTCVSPVGELLNGLTGKKAEDCHFPLSPIQSMFFDKQPQAFNHFNQSFLLKLTKAISSENMVAAIGAVVQRHSMLRARFRQVNGIWTQLVTANIKQSYRYRYVSVSDKAQMEAEMETSQLSLDIVNGPLISFDQIESGDESFLFLVAHHLVIDPVSWRIIMNDLETVLNGNGPLEECPLQFHIWNRLQSEYVRSHLPPLATLASSEDLQYLQSSYMDFWGLDDRPSTWHDTGFLSFELDTETTKRLLGEANNTFDTKPIELFHAVVLFAFTEIFQDRPAPIIWNAAHGREPWDPSLDLSQTVGWFTTMWPAVVPMDSQHTLVETLQLTKDARRRIPSNGWAYFSSQHFHPEGKVLKSKGPIEIVLNFHGLYQQLERDDALFQQATHIEYTHHDLSPEAQQFELFELVISGSNGKLEFKMEYNSRVQHLDRVKKWFFHCQNVLAIAADQLAKIP